MSAAVINRILFYLCVIKSIQLLVHSIVNKMLHIQVHSVSMHMRCARVCVPLSVETSERNSPLARCAGVSLCALSLIAVRICERVSERTHQLMPCANEIHPHPFSRNETKWEMKEETEKKTKTLRALHFTLDSLFMIMYWMMMIHCIRVLCCQSGDRSSVRTIYIYLSLHTRKWYGLALAYMPYAQW